MMKILNTKQIKDWDAYTIENEPIHSIDLMERAAYQLFLWITKHYSKQISFVIYAGPGNNGGDALALARMLYVNRYLNIRLILLKISDSLSKDGEINLERLKSTTKVPILELNEGDDFPELSTSDIVIDGIFGSGLRRSVNGYWGSLLNNINNSFATIISIDIPSGLFADYEIENNGVIVKANFTLTFQLPKLSFFFVDNYPFIGKWYVLNIGLSEAFIDTIESGFYFTEEGSISKLLKKRHLFDHKGTYGHAFLIAGSYQKTGAAVLAARACMRAGVGLLTVHVPESGREIMQTAVPEAMVCIDETEMSYCENSRLDKFEAVGVGPGIGKKKSIQTALLRLLENNTKPMVLDADALNILAENKEYLRLLPKSSIITPHPGEFDRLTQKHDTSYERWKTQMEFSQKYNVIVVLKGAYTSICDSEGSTYFNSTGNPGMATAGSGDVLTGIILSLLAQNYEPLDAAIVGVYLHGKAGDIAAKKMGLEALIASDIINCLGNAFKKVQKGLMK